MSRYPSPSDSPRPSSASPAWSVAQNAEERAQRDEVTLGEVGDAGGLHDHEEAERGQRDDRALGEARAEQRDEERRLSKKPQIAQARNTRPATSQPHCARGHAPDALDPRRGRRGGLRFADLGRELLGQRTWPIAQDSPLRARRRHAAVLSPRRVRAPPARRSARGRAAWTSTRTPRCASASPTALAAAACAPIAPPSPMPLYPPGLVVESVSMWPTSISGTSLVVGGR